MDEQTRTIALTERECDLVTRALKYVVTCCDNDLSACYTPARYARRSNAG
jgi:hypothetical protein